MPKGCLDVGGIRGLAEARSSARRSWTALYGPPVQLARLPGMFNLATPSYAGSGARTLLVASMPQWAHWAALRSA